MLCYCFTASIEANYGQVIPLIGVTLMVALPFSCSAVHSLCSYRKRPTDLEHTSVVPFGSGSFQAATDSVNTAPTGPTATSARVQVEVLVATDRVTDASSFIAVPTTFFAKI